MIDSNVLLIIVAILSLIVGVILKTMDMNRQYMMEIVHLLIELMNEKSNRPGQR